MRLRRKLAAARQLSVRDWWLFLQAWWLLLFVDLALRTMPFKKIAAWATADAASAERLSDRSQALEYWQAVYTAAHNHLYPMTCLRRALVLKKMLSSRFNVELRVGNYIEDGKLIGHAWVDVDGVPLGEKEIGSFQPIL